MTTKFTNHVVQNPGRYRIENGPSSLLGQTIDLLPQFGNTIVQGTPMDAESLNDILITPNTVNGMAGGTTSRISKMPVLEFVEGTETLEYVSVSTGTLSAGVIACHSNNLVDKLRIMEKAYIRSDGLPEASNNLFATDFEIVAAGNGLYYDSGSNSSVTGIGFYDINKVLVSWVANSTIIAAGNVIDVPTNARYFRASFGYAAKTLDNAMINYGPTALPYEAYKRNELYINDDITSSSTIKLVNENGMYYLVYANNYPSNSVKTYLNTSGVFNLVPNGYIHLYSRTTLSNPIFTIGFTAAANIPGSIGQLNKKINLVAQQVENRWFTIYNGPVKNIGTSQGASVRLTFDERLTSFKELVFEWSIASAPTTDAPRKLAFLPIYTTSGVDTFATGQFFRSSDSQLCTVVFRAFTGVAYIDFATPKMAVGTGSFAALTNLYLYAIYGIE